MAVVIPIIVIIAVGVATIIVLAANRQRSATGSLSRETRQRDASEVPEAATSTELETIGLEESGRERADETRDRFGNVPAERAAAEVTRWEPVDEEEIGVTRRQFLNRGLVTTVGFSLAGFGAACLGFLWPTSSAGFGGKVNAGKVSDITDEIESKAAPFYVPEARAYIVQYPKTDLAAAKKVYSAITYAGMEQGFVALYQRCVHLGCRVPWCPTSQWFECPCHGSKYNRVGEKKAGPAPRGLDRFEISVSDTITINTGDIQIGPPIGTNTTGQQQEGPLCV